MTLTDTRPSIQALPARILVPARWLILLPSARILTALRLWYSPRASMPTSGCGGSWQRGMTWARD